MAVELAEYKVEEDNNWSIGKRINDVLKQAGLEERMRLIFDNFSNLIGSGIITDEEAKRFLSSDVPAVLVERYESLETISSVPSTVFACLVENGVLVPDPNKFGVFSINLPEGYKEPDEEYTIGFFGDIDGTDRVAIQMHSKDNFPQFTTP